MTCSILDGMTPSSCVMRDFHIITDTCAAWGLLKPWRRRRRRWWLGIHVCRGPIPAIGYAWPARRLADRAIGPRTFPAAEPYLPPMIGRRCSMRWPTNPISEIITPRSPPRLATAAVGYSSSTHPSILPSTSCPKQSVFPAYYTKTPIKRTQIYI